MGTTLLALATLSRQVKTLTVPTVCLVLTLATSALLRQAMLEATILPVAEVIRKLSDAPP